MGRTGPKSKAPGGYGTITPKGYRRIWDIPEQRFRMEHVVIWERHNGPVPAGMQVHHRNHNKLDNSIENLELVDTLTHKRLHSGCELRDGQWWKPCRKCGILQPIANYYKRKDGVSPWCKACAIDNADINYRKRQKRKAG